MLTDREAQHLINLINNPSHQSDLTLQERLALYEKLYAISNRAT